MGNSIATDNHCLRLLACIAACDHAHRTRHFCLRAWCTAHVTYIVKGCTAKCAAQTDCYQAHSSFGERMEAAVATGSNGKPCYSCNKFALGGGVTVFYTAQQDATDVDPKSGKKLLVEVKTLHRTRGQPIPLKHHIDCYLRGVDALVVIYHSRQCGRQCVTDVEFLTLDNLCARDRCRQLPDAIGFLFKTLQSIREAALTCAEGQECLVSYTYPNQGLTVTFREKENDGGAAAATTPTTAARPLEAERGPR